MRNLKKQLFKLVLGFIFSMPTLSFAETGRASDTKIAASLNEVLFFKGVHSSVSINVCMVEITTLFQQPCGFWGSVKSSRHLIDLAEFKNFRIEPYRGQFVIKADLDIPSPSTLKFLYNRLILGFDEHLKQVGEEQRQWISQADLDSGETSERCDDQVFSQPQKLFLTLFISRPPTEWHAFLKLQSDCRAASTPP